MTLLKFKEKSSEEVPHYKLLLWIVRLIHADPILMLHVSVIPLAKMEETYHVKTSLIVYI